MGRMVTAFRLPASAPVHHAQPVRWSDRGSTAGSPDLYAIPYTLRWFVRRVDYRLGVRDAIRVPGAHDVLAQPGHPDVFRDRWRRPAGARQVPVRVHRAGLDLRRAGRVRVAGQVVVLAAG